MRNSKRAIAVAIPLLCLNLSAKPASITLNESKISFKKAIELIQESSGYSFVFSSQDMNIHRQVSLALNNNNIQDAVEQVIAGENVTYEIEGKNIILSKAQDDRSAKQEDAAKERQITGTIVDENNETVIGANVILQGDKTIGTITDFDGKFTLSVPENAVLVISYIGYDNLILPIDDKKNYSIQLKSVSQELEEVVVVGYGTQKKVNLTGAVESISKDALDDRPIRSATDALQGNALGVTVASEAGRPGKFSSIKIRGEASLNSAGALVLIDGMPGDINSVNPQDIENISVLKDAASAAIYGSRAAEGVILITTKQGSSSKTEISYSGNFSFNKPTRMPESTSALEHAELSNIAFKNAGLSPQFTEEAIAAIKDPSIVSIPNGNDWIYTADVDWIDMMMDQSFQQTHNLTVSRSQESLKYLFSAGWLDQNGLFAEYGPDNFDRFNLRSNVNFEMIKDKLNFDSRIVFTRTNNRFHPEVGSWSIPYMTFVQAGPNMPIYDSNGNFARYRMQCNPIQAMQEGGEGKSEINRLEGVFTLSYNPIKDLTLKAVGGVRINQGNTMEWRRAYGKYGPNGLISMAAGQNKPNSLLQRTNKTEYYNGQFLADYQKTVGKHDVGVLAGWSAELQTYEMLEARRTNIIGNELPALELGSTNGWSNTADDTHWALLSGFMRINYAYASKYLVEANFRADGSSRFSQNNKWGFFPSFSLGWRLTEEQFMQEQEVFSNIKFRASWGQLGNQNGLGLYDHIPQYTVDGYYPFENELAQWAMISKLPSTARTWETVEMRNVAVEMGFLNNRLTVTGEYFLKNNRDMLVKIEVPSIIGIDVPTGNYGELEVKGWEASIGWRDRIQDFQYAASFYLTDRKDKLVDYGVNFNGFTSGINQKIQGYSIGAIFGFQADGYFQTTEEAKKAPAFNKTIQDAGDIRYVDQDGDGKITAPNDLVYLGTTQPRYEFGINLSASWKGFDVSTVIQGVGKRNFYLNREVFQPFGDTWSNYSYSYFSDYWTPDNRNALLPRLYTGVGHNYQTSSHWLQNAAYVRLKNLQVGYTFNRDLTKKWKLEKVRLYFSGENLCEYSKLFKYYDPEITMQAGYMYPIMRSFSFGVNVTI